MSFPLGAKLEVNGPQRHSLYRLLAGEGAEFPGDITWNFEKFLVGKDGRVLARFAPRTAPDDPAVVQAIEKALAEYPGAIAGQAAAQSRWEQLS